VNRQDGGTGPENQKRPAEAPDSEAARTAIVIAGLRSRLKRPGVLTSPAVLRELRKLEEDVAAGIEQDYRNRGKHRSRASKAATSQVADASGIDLKPDPLTARTPAEYIVRLRQYKAWSGDPSWRKMASRAGQAVVHSTMHAAMNGTTLPRFEVVRAIITGCGGNDEDLRAFATAWRRLDSARTVRRTGPEFLAAPIAPLSPGPGGPAALFRQRGLFTH
jgi:hypothetical protein